MAGMAGMDLKFQCHLIESLVRRTPEGAKRLMGLQKDWVAKMLGEMKEGGVGPAVGKCLAGVLMVRLTELTNEDPEVYPGNSQN